MRKIQLAILAVAMLLASSGQASADLIVNGGFETGDFTGWNVSSGVTNVNGVDTIYPHSGAYGAYFGSTTLVIDSLSQEVAGVVGTAYQLSFWLHVTDDNTQGLSNLWNVYWEGNLVAGEINRPTDAAYVQFVYTVTATSALSELLFEFGNDSNFYDLDDVSIAAVPVPAGFVMMGIGLAGLAACSLRKRYLTNLA